jgi:hypothetical protein
LVKFSVDLDISGAVKLTNALTKQIPFAMAEALTLTAIQAQTDIIQAMTQVFDRPTPYTLNATYVIPATKDRLESFVQLKDSAAKGTPAIKFLDPEVFGGERNPKRGEKALQRMGALASGSFIVPGAGLKLDQYGNISAGTMTKILSAVQANPDYYQNVTQKSRKRAIAAGRNLEYFVGRSPSGANRLGVWERDGRHLHPILIFIDRAPSYRERLKFYAIAQATYERVYQRFFNDAFADAIATARL